MNYLQDGAHSGRNLTYSINRIEKGDYDVFHPTFFDDYFVKHLNGKPFVLTIHDMIPELFSTSDKLQIENKKRLAQSASHIIAVSEKTKEDIVELLKIPEDKISVIYHGAMVLPLVYKASISHYLNSLISCMWAIETITRTSCP